MRPSTIFRKSLDIPFDGLIKNIFYQSSTRYLSSYTVKPISNTLWQLGQMKSHWVVPPFFLKML